MDCDGDGTGEDFRGTGRVPTVSCVVPEWPELALCHGEDRADSKES